MKRKIAQILLDTEAVFLSVAEPFTWTSGLRSPIYCDNRKVLAFPEARTVIKDALVAAVREEMAKGPIDAIMGTSTAGIPMATMIADELDLPLGYVRGEKKGHGRQNQIEGFVQANARVIVIEDMISTGKSVIQVVDALREAEMSVVTVLAIFSYQMAVAEQQLGAKDITYRTLSDFTELAQLAHDTGELNERQLRQVRAFQQDPSNTDWLYLT